MSDINLLDVSNDISRFVAVLRNVVGHEEITQVSLVRKCAD